MKKFVFTLQSVYDVSLADEKQQKLQLQRIEAQLAQMRRQFSETQAAYTLSKETCNREMKVGIGGEKLAQYSFYFESLLNTMDLLQETIKKAEEQREYWIKERIKTRNKLRTLDKIREKQWEAHQKEAQKEEENELGDMISYRVASEGEKSRSVYGS